MSEQAGFAELLRRHEELTQSFARLLHDDAGQILTAIALELSVLEGVEDAERTRLMATLDDLLERFRDAQAGLGAAAVAKRGLAAGLSQLARYRSDLRVEVVGVPAWPLEAQMAAFRIVESIEPQAVRVDTGELKLEGGRVLGDYERSLAESGKLSLPEVAPRTTIKICHANSGVNR